MLGRRREALDERLASVTKDEADEALASGAPVVIRKLSPAEQRALDRAIARRDAKKSKEQPKRPPLKTNEIKHATPAPTNVPGAPAPIDPIEAASKGSAVRKDPARSVRVPANLASAIASETIRTTTAVMAMVTIKGDPKELLEAYHAYQGSVDERGGPAPGLLSHACAVNHEGLLLIDVWSSEAALKAWLARTPGQPMPRMYPVHGLRTAPLSRGK